LLSQKHKLAEADITDEATRLSEDLRIYATELEIQTEELIQAQQRAELANQRYQQLFDHLPMPALVVDKHGLIRHDNQQARSWLGEPIPSGYERSMDRRLLRGLEPEGQRRFSQQLLKLATLSIEANKPTVLQDVFVTDTNQTQRHVVLHILPLPLTYHVDGLLLLLIDDRSAEKQLKTQGYLLQALIDSSEDRVCATDTQGRLMLCNQAVLVQLQRSLEDVIGCTHEELMPLPQALRHQHTAQQVLATGQPRTFTEEVEDRQQQGCLRIYETNKFPLRDGDGSLIGVGCISRDVSQAQQVQREQRLSEAVFMSAKEAIIVTDADTRIIRVNPAFERLSGFSGKTVTGQKASLLRSGRQAMGFYQAMWASIHTTGHWEGELTNRSATGEYYTVWSTITALYDQHGQLMGYMAVQTDLTALRLAESEVARLSSYDSLTGLPNRALLMERLERSQAYAHRHGDVFSLLFADLDHFKEVNDTFGHQTGDLLLQTIAQRLQESVREQDTVARIGGDEFIVLLPSTKRDAALGLAKKLQTVIRKPLNLETLHDYQPQISIGVAEYPTDGDSAQLLLRNADTAMYAAKLGGRNRTASYTSAMSEASARLFALQTDLAKSVERGELRMVLQPKFRLSDRQIIGAEALVRWHRPLHGLISPSDFIPCAEKAGLVGVIDMWMLEHTIQHIFSWHQKKIWPHAWTVALNQTASDLRNHIWLEHIQQLLQEYPIPAGSLQIELTESDLLQPTPDMIAQLQALRRLGIGLAIDDFGTGYSSLAYLKSLPVSVIKIDQGFIREMTTDANARILVEAMIELAHKLGYTLVAEGVETEAQLATLHKLGCEAGQDYLIGTPVSVSDFEGMYIYGNSSALSSA
jgi:diguanylate cyclase (GGDEF)-like protein/PAS domain S-box-containing protein